MKSTAQKLIFISFILALIAALIVFLYLKSLEKPVKTINKISILVAAETIPSRTLIDKKMIKEIKVPEDPIFNDYIKDSSKIIGKYAKEVIMKNEGFNADKLLDSNGNELSLKISNNHRAISLSVTGDSGVSDLLKPGDFVDIISYTAERKDGTKVVRPDLAKVILQNIELLAVDKQISRDATAPSQTTSNEQMPTSFLVTLSIPVRDLEKLVLAESIGNIMLALRPLQDAGIVNEQGATYDNSLSVNTNNVSDNGNALSSKNTINNVSNTKNMNNKGNKAQNYVSYTIKRGDTLKSISREFYKDGNKYEVIKAANNIEQENLILAGQVIKIPIN